MSTSRMPNVLACQRRQLYTSQKAPHAITRLLNTLVGRAISAVYATVPVIRPVGQDCSSPGDDPKPSESGGAAHRQTPATPVRWKRLLGVTYARDDAYLVLRKRDQVGITLLD